MQGATGRSFIVMSMVMIVIMVMAVRAVRVLMLDFVFGGRTYVEHLDRKT